MREQRDFMYVGPSPQTKRSVFVNGFRVGGFNDAEMAAQAAWRYNAEQKRIQPTRAEAERPKVELPPYDERCKEEIAVASRKEMGAIYTIYYYKAALDSRERQLLAALTEIAEEQRRLAVSERATEQVQREMDDMTRRYTAAAELNKRLLDVLRGALVFVENEQQCRETSYFPEPTADEEPYLIEASDAVVAIRTAIADTEAALANEVPQAAGPEVPPEV